MCQSRFQESENHLVQLPEDDPVIIRRLVEYFYALTYELESEDLPSQLHELLDLYIYADKYQLEHLRRSIIEDHLPHLESLQEGLQHLFPDAARTYRNTTEEALQQFRS